MTTDEEFFLFFLFSFAFEGWLPTAKSEGEEPEHPLADSRAVARNPSVFSALDHTTVIKGTHLSG